MHTGHVQDQKHYQHLRKCPVLVVNLFLNVSIVLTIITMLRGSPSHPHIQRFTQTHRTQYIVVLSIQLYNSSVYSCTVYTQYIVVLTAKISYSNVVRADICILRGKRQRQSWKDLCVVFFMFSPSHVWSLRVHFSPAVKMQHLCQRSPQRPSAQSFYWVLVTQTLSAQYMLKFQTPRKRTDFH